MGYEAEKQQEKGEKTLLIYRTPSNSFRTKAVHLTKFGLNGKADLYSKKN